MRSTSVLIYWWATCLMDGEGAVRVPMEGTKLVGLIGGGGRVKEEEEEEE